MDLHSEFNMPPLLCVLSFIDHLLHDCQFGSFYAFGYALG